MGTRKRCSGVATAASHTHTRTRTHTHTRALVLTNALTNAPTNAQDPSSRQFVRGQLTPFVLPASYYGRVVRLLRRGSFSSAQRRSGCRLSPGNFVSTHLHIPASFNRPAFVSADPLISLFACVASGCPGRNSELMGLICMLPVGPWGR